MLLALAGATAAFLRSRRSDVGGGVPEWPPFEPRLVPSPAPAPAGNDESAAWIAPASDGSVPDSHPVKVKVSSGIFHVPGGRFYDRTTADRLYPTTESAEADGYRPSKS